MAAIKSGFTSVMMDGSLEADGKSVASYEYNVDVSREVVKFSHSIGVTVEAELGVLGSLETMQGDKEDGHGADGKMTREQLLTDVEQAADFVKATQCDALAIAIGTSHGAYKFTKKPTGDILAIERIKEIHTRIPNTHLVMHGSSSVPQELLAEIREICKRRGFPLHVVEGPRGNKNSWLNNDGSNNPDTARLTIMAPHVSEADVYICGPQAWTDSVIKSVRKAGTPLDNIHSEEYAW